MTTTISTETRIAVGETSLQLLRGGSGPPAVVLHGVEGPEGWLPFHEALARGASVYAPTQPGYGETPRPEWLETVPQLALFYHWFLQEAGLDQVDLIGFGVGGWIAAEMAVMSPRSLRKLVLVDAAGLRPSEGEIRDIFIIPWREVVERSFFDADASAEYHRIYEASPLVDFGGVRESGRSMAMRSCYRPYMYDAALLPLLGRLRLPTLIVWGEDDAIIPLECGRLYQRAIAGATLRVIERCGHWPHYERPEELAATVREFLSR